MPSDRIVPRFDPANRPRFDPPPGGQGPRALDPDCCDRPECPQRDFNRAVALTLDRLAQAYAAQYLLLEACGRVWRCSDAGHTEGCADPACTFARDMQRRLTYNRERLESAVVGLFRILSSPALDLEGEWQDFADAEQAWVGLTSGADPTMYLELLRELAVGYNGPAYDRWFLPTRDAPEILEGEDAP